MGISFVAAASAQAQNANLVVSKPAGVQAGDILFAMYSQYNNNPTIPPAGWTYMGGDGLQVSQVFKEAGSSEPSSYTLATGVDSLYASGVIVAYRGSRRDFALEPIIDGGIAYSPGIEFNFGTATVTFAHATSQGTQQRIGMALMVGVCCFSAGVGSLVHSVGWPPANIVSRASIHTADNRVFIGFGDRLGPLNPPITNYTPGSLTFQNSGGFGRSWCSSTQFLNREQNKQGGTVI